MLPVSYFLPIHKKGGIGGQTSSAKRKRDDVETELDEVSASAKPLRGEQQPSDGEGALHGGLHPADAHERRGLHTSSEYQAPEPSSETPDRPEDWPMTSKQSISEHSTVENLGELKPPLLGRGQHPSARLHGGQGARGSGARQRHLALLTAILHRSLLQHDYVRAGRVWGMLLRTEVHGHSVDLRDGYRWGLGAEILLQRQKGLSQASSQICPAVEADSSAVESSDLCITSDDFDRVRQYYDRLSIQYPYNKSFPNATGPLDFRFAILSLWIYVSTNREAPNRDDSRQEALRQGREISQSLGELMSSPPYSDSKRFRDLKHMVDLWTVDLAAADLRDGTDTSIGPSITDVEVDD